MPEASLYFAPTHRPCGFTNPELAQFDGSAEPVVRELLQNSLDAADKADRPAEVRFVITEVPKVDIPGWCSYEQAFRRAVADRDTRGVEPSHDERTTRSRIVSSMEKRTVPLLLCIDNGHGLDGARMDALLTSGNTDKGEGGAGSFGLGHYAAFAASDLRWVLYGSRHSSNGVISTMFSAHAILATHRDGDDNRLQAADGYWFDLGKADRAFDGTGDAYAADIPAVFAPHLRDDRTGTVVCIAGFNDFRREDDDDSALEQIARVAAANFSDAIVGKRLRMTVEDDRQGDGPERLDVARDQLEELLAPIKDQRRAPRRGQIRGELAYQAWRTLDAGRTTEQPAGVRICWRLFGDYDRSTTRVHLFRKGMWITSDAPGLRKADFSDSNPFDAVLSLDAGQLEDLVRNAEGPEHRGLDPKRLTPAERKDLHRLLGEAAEFLRDAAGRRDPSEEFTPPGFATIAGATLRSAETLRRPRLPAGGGERVEPIARGENPTGGRQPKSRRHGTPRPGSSPRYRSTLRQDGRTVVKASVDFLEEVAAGSMVGLRLRRASGSDATCDVPERDDFLRLEGVSDDTGMEIPSDESESGYELTIPAVEGRRELMLHLDEPIDDIHLLELDLVRRRQASSPCSGGDA